MQISPLSLIHSAPVFRGTVANPFLKNYYNDSFKKRIVNKDKLHAKDDKANFKLLPKLFRDVKYESLPEECKKEAFNSIVAGNMIKKLYDKEYGEGNYVFVSVGTSPACVGRYLEYMEQDVRYIPISGIRKLGFPPSQLTEYQSYDRYSNFLDSIGLDRKSVISSGKKYIFCDYTKTGTTLDAVEYFARNHRCLPSSCVEFRSLNNDMAEYAKNKPKLLEKVIEYTDSLCNSKLAKYSGVPHLNCMVADAIDEVLKEPRSKDSKDFNFAMLYLMNKEGLLS